ncbi:MAG: hypothetical protein BWK76_09635 [Desulfobulbaceae bacterium A2]|nr:MAG: hypothetical protein BWK76_09635 [Desulfobulbaceae bacterium A2]
MKKLGLALVVLLIAAVLAAPYVSGMVMERTVRQAVVNMNKMYGEAGQDIRADIVQYQRGYASSEIVWKVGLGPLQALYGIGEVQLVERAKHGFGSIVSTTSLEKNPWYTKFVQEKLAGKDPLHITTQYSLSGKIASTIALDGITLPVETETVAIKPGKMVASCDKEFKHFLGDVTWGGLAVGEKIVLEGLALKSDLTLISPFVWDGTISLAVPHVKAAKDPAERLELANLKGKYTLRFNKEQNTMSGMVDYGFDRLEVGQEKVENAFVRIGMNGINVPAYKEFMTMYSRTMGDMLGEIVAAKGSAADLSKVNEKKMVMIGLQMMAASEKLLTKGLEFQIADLRLRLPDGEIKGDLTLRLNKDMTFLQFVPLTQQPALALDIFSLKSNLSLPQQMVGNNTMLLQPLFPGMRTGLLVPSGANYVHKAETKDNKLLLNDQEVQLR